VFLQVRPERRVKRFLDVGFLQFLQRREGLSNGSEGRDVFY
jgi:hypothetical protein